MVLLIAIVVIVIAGGIVFKKKRPSEAKRHARSKLIAGKNVSTPGHPARTFRPATYCGHPGCDQLSVICKRKVADAEHWEGFLGQPRKKR